MTPWRDRTEREWTLRTAKHRATGDAPPDERLTLTKSKLQPDPEPEPEPEPSPNVQPVEVWNPTDAKRLILIRALLAAVIAGLGSLAAASHGDDPLTLSAILTAAVAAAAAAGTVYGVRSSGGEPLLSTMTTRDLGTMTSARAQATSRAEIKRDTRSKERGR